MIVPIEMNGREKFLSRIVQPDVFFILLILGALGLYVEFTHPGMFAPGVIGGIALLLALFAMHLLPVNFAGIALIAFALALFVLEAKFPDARRAGRGRRGLHDAGRVNADSLADHRQGSEPGNCPGGSIPFAIIIIFLMRLVLRSHSWKPSTGKEELIGEEGQVTEPIGLDPPPPEWYSCMANCGAPLPSTARRSPRARACA